MFFVMLLNKSKKTNFFHFSEGTFVTVLSYQQPTSYASFAAT